jgi:hypothetical protein
VIFFSNILCSFDPLPVPLTRYGEGNAAQALNLGEDTLPGADNIHRCAHFGNGEHKHQWMLSGRKKVNTFKGKPSKQLSWSMMTF